jgi:uncharacterized protein YktB (UPF0637 family)
VPQNRWENEDSVGHASRSSGLLHLEASRARVFQSSLKTDEGVTWMVHVASSRRSRGDKAEDRWVDVMGCIRLFYHNFVVFVVLVHKGSLFIGFSIIRTSMAGEEVSIQSSLCHP